jgi:hypothetical protein
MPTRQQQKGARDAPQGAFATIFRYWIKELARGLREGGMMEARKMTGAFLLGTGVMLTLLPAGAHAFELSGAWATQDDLCKLVFARKGSEVVFAELSDLYGSGFVIDGDRIKGKAAQCTIKSKKQDGDTIELSAACATLIMTQDMLFSLKIVDDNNVSRNFSEVPGMSLRYSRCKL